MIPVDLRPVARKLVTLAAMHEQLGGPYGTECLLHPPEDVLAVANFLAQAQPDAVGHYNPFTGPGDVGYILRLVINTTTIEIFDIAPTEAIKSSLNSRIGSDLVTMADRWTREQAAQRNVGVSVMIAALQPETALPAEVAAEGLVAIRNAWPDAMARIDEQAAEVERLKKDLAKLQEEDDNAADQLREAIDENLPDYALSDDDDDLANHVERVEYAGARIDEMQRELDGLRAELAAVRKVAEEAIGLGLVADDEGWPQPTTRSDRLRELRALLDAAVKP